MKKAPCSAWGHLLDGLPHIDLADLVEGLREKDRRGLGEAIIAY
ncbi:MAG: hypothetical protein QXE22_04550 [Candidatus Bathyarchaeia archaeon]